MNEQTKIIQEKPKHSILKIMKAGGLILGLAGTGALAFGLCFSVWHRKMIIQSVKATPEYNLAYEAKSAELFEKMNNGELAVSEAQEQLKLLETDGSVIDYIYNSENKVAKQSFDIARSEYVASACMAAPCLVGVTLYTVASGLKRKKEEKESFMAIEKTYSK